MFHFIVVECSGLIEAACALLLVEELLNLGFQLEADDGGVDNDDCDEEQLNGPIECDDRRCWVFRHCEDN
jgi:hypothetical protein